MCRYCLLILAIASFAIYAAKKNTQCPHEPLGRSYAILIGLNDYNINDSILPQLHYAKSDVNRMAKLLSKQKYIIDSATDSRATKDNIIKLIEYRISKVSCQDRILFYFSGHGNVSNDILLLYLWQEDGSFFPKEHLDVPWLCDQITGSRAMQQVLIIDACFSGQVGIPQIPVQSFYTNKIVDANFFALTTWAESVRETIYTDAIVEALSGKADRSGYCNRDGIVDAFELGRYVDEKVSRTTDKNGNRYRSRMVFIGSGELPLTSVDCGK